MILYAFPFTILKLTEMNWDSQILEWERPHFTYKQVDIILVNDICITETKNFALIEVNFQTRELLKKYTDTLYMESFFEVMSRKIIVSFAYCKMEIPPSTRCGIKPSN
jgi:hypothetical protein